MKTYFLVSAKYLANSTGLFFSLYLHDVKNLQCFDVNQLTMLQYLVPHQNFHIRNNSQHSKKLAI